MAKHITHHSPIAVAYATALLELANEHKQAEKIAEEFAGLREVLKQTPNFGLYLSDPAVGETERSTTIKKIFGGRVSELMSNFLGVLNMKSRLGDLSDIADAFDALLDVQLGKIEVDVTVSQKLTPEQLEDVRKRVGTALKKDAIIHQYVDDAIIGGMVLRVQDKLIDASVRTQLRAMKQQLLSTQAK